MDKHPCDKCDWNIHNETKYRSKYICIYQVPYHIPVEQKEAYRFIILKRFKKISKPPSYICLEL